MKVKELFAIIFFIAATGIQLKAQTPIQKMTKYAGDWNATYTMWMDPSQPSMTSDLKVHNEMIMNGLFFISHYTGIVMEMNYEALSTIGYSLEKNKYVSTWIDNMNSGIDYREGKASDDGKKIEFNGSSFDMVTGKDIPTRQVLTLTDETHQTIEFFTIVNGKEMKSIEIDLSR